LIVITLPVGIIQTNCYLVGDPGTREAAIIDPGGDVDHILAAVKRHSLQVRYVLNTHGHFDHTDGNAGVLAATGAVLAIHPLDRPLLAAGGGAAWFGVPTRPGPDPALDLAGGDRLVIGKLTLEVLFTPGHTPGHVSFYERTEGVVFDGDVLFNGGVGRTDLPGGSWPQLEDSIRSVLLPLPDETVVYSGHGPATTIGDEKRYNPWIR
jgi:glyoxylase-like metal-dependent hydrolase (beta-lactamase superfamily II)